MRLKTAPILLTLTPLALLAGCGGGGGSTSTSTTISTTTTTTTQRSAAKPEPEQQSAGDSKGSTSQPASGSVPTDPNPLPNQGTKAVAPGVPTAKGGDNSIQTFGVEADTAERAQVASLLNAYLHAEAAGRWGAACAHLASMLQQKFATLGNSSPASLGKGCAGGIGTLFSKAPKAILHSVVPIHVLSLRVSEPRAFVIYRNGAGKAYNLPLIREGGRWRIAAPLGIELVL
jgi:hypothetical protein